MISYTKAFLSIGLLSFVSSCDFGKLTFLADIENNLKEVSAVEFIPQSNLFWAIEDAGNDNVLYGLDAKGNVVSEIIVQNSKNKDWEDLTSDKDGNIYIGDFGNNSKKRETFQIYKVDYTDLKSTSAEASVIEFKMPKGVKPKDFEAFFLYDKYFYLFSKSRKKGILIRVKNEIGQQNAEWITTFKLSGKNNRITSADISNDGKTIVLLNHDKLWNLTNFEGNHFFEGTIESVLFEHSSQKEGVCFKDNTTVIITDERKGSEGGNIYQFSLE